MTITFWRGRHTSQVSLKIITTMVSLIFAANSANADSIQKYTSAHLVVYSELPPREAMQRLRRMEQAVRLASSYWRSPLPGKLECYLVDDLANWESFHFPSDDARQVLHSLGGGTETAQEKPHHRAAGKAVVYATTTPGIAEHEVIHAYCFQTFGRGGPDWYREGMAELFAQQLNSSTDSPCRTETYQILKQSPRRASEVIRQPFTDELRRWMKSTRDLQPYVNGTANYHDNPPPNYGKQLSDIDGDVLRTAKENYANSWALCYILFHHKAYRDRFRAAGIHLLSGGHVSFAQVFANQMEELDFELSQFAQHVCPGYRFELCRWSWPKDCATLEVGRSKIVRLRSRRGFQPTELRVEQGQTYRVVTTGSWKIAETDATTDADGTEHGDGRLVGVLVDNYQLTAPLDFGSKAELTVKQQGDLYLRCQEDWDQLSDNYGIICVRLTRVR